MIRLSLVNPQSYNNLSKYDLSFIGALNPSDLDGRIRYYCSVLLDRPVPRNVDAKRVFTYNTRRSTVAKVFYYGLSMLKLLVDAFRHRADVYHFQWVKVPLVDLFVILVLRWSLRARIVLTAHNVVPHDKEAKRHRALGLVYGVVDHIIVHSASTAMELIARFSVSPSRVSVIPHGLINLDGDGECQHAASVEAFTKSRNLCFLFFGRGNRYKGLDILFGAWSRIAKYAEGKCGLIVMGQLNSDLKRDAMALAKVSGDTLLLIDDFVPEADLLYAARKSDAVILPYRNISQSGALLSVIGLNVPVIVSELPGLIEPLGIGDVGWIFDGSEDALVKLLRELIECPDSVSEKRVNISGWRAIREFYNWEGIGEKAMLVYRRLV